MIASQNLLSKNHPQSKSFSTCNLPFFISDRVWGRAKPQAQKCEGWGARGGVRGQQWDLLITDLFYSPAVLNCLDTLKWNFSVIFQVTSSWPTSMEGSRRDEMLSFTCNIYYLCGFSDIKERTVTQATFFTLKRALKKQVFIGLPQATLVLNTLPPG